MEHWILPERELTLHVIVVVAIFASDASSAIVAVVVVAIAVLTTVSGLVVVAVAVIAVAILIGVSTAAGAETFAYYVWNVRGGMSFGL